jgi:3-oxoadipate enol-lactonase
VALGEEVRTGDRGEAGAVRKETALLMLARIPSLRHGVAGSLLLSCTALLLCSPIAAGVAAQTAGSLHFDRSGYLSIGADSLYFESVGTGPTVILIHDGMVHREVWDYQVPAFARMFTVVRYDRRGYGKSSLASEPFSNVEDLNALLEHLQIDSTALIGMSSGGRLAIDFTLQHPEKVTSLVLVGAVVDGFPYTQHFFGRGGHMPTDLSIEQRIAYMASDDPYEIYAGNAAAKERVRKLMAGGRVQGHASFARARPIPPAAERLGEIHVPTLILVGEFDIPDVHAHAGAINLGIRSSTRDVIPKAGHLIPVEQPEVFNAKVLEFLEANAR